MAPAQYRGSTMRAFGPGGFGQSDDPWFRLGNYDVNTTTLITGLGVLSMLVWAIEGAGGPIFEFLALDTDKIASFQFWRIITWPIPNAPDIWTILLLVIFYMLGNQLEQSMGNKRLFAYFLGAMTVIPAIVITLFAWLSGSALGISGLRYLELGILCAFAAKWPKAPFFFGIPAWVLAAVIVVIESLQAIGLRGAAAMLLLWTVVAVSLVTIRSMGFADESPWIPKVPLPASLGGTPGSGGGPNMSRPAKKRGKGRAKLKSVPPPNPIQNDLNDMEIDALLDQVANDGLDSLTKDQRKALEQHSKRLRKRDEQ